MSRISMSEQELDRHDVICRLIRKEINGTDAARLLKLSTRHVRNLKCAVQRHGPSGLIHGNRGKPSNHRLPVIERERIIRLLHGRYHDFHPTFAAEKLEECHSIDRDPKTIRSIMIAEGLWKTDTRKHPEYRSWRQRRSCRGELVQFDGSYEHWFEDRGPEVCLLAAIDDASSELVDAEFAPHEGVVPVFTFWRAYALAHGVPRNIYLDRFSTYRMTQRVAVENHDLKTQFERAMQELRCELIFARSPQAKGRVERLFGTLQDRLIKELRLAKISTIPEANQFLKTIFIPTFNRRFAVTPALATDLHRSLTGKETLRLEAIFSRQETRTVRNDFTVSYANTWYQLERHQPVTVCRGDVLTIEERLDGAPHFRLRGRYLHVRALPERPRKTGSVPWVLAAAPIHSS